MIFQGVIDASEGSLYHAGTSMPHDPASPPIFKKIPVTLLTGFLGAGKTTLLNHLLRTKTTEKIVVIVNEFGAVDIDGTLVVGGEEHLVTLDNGCICCTVRNDLIETLTDLLKRRLQMDGAAPLEFDRVVIETTGLADPIPLIQTFMLDEVLMTAYEISAVVTVVDALHIGKQLGYLPVAAEQIALADLILLSKTDLLPAAERVAVESRIRQINPSALIVSAVMGAVPNAELFQERRFFSAPQLPQAESGHLDHERSEHLDQIQSVALMTDVPLDLDRLYAWIGELQNSLGPNLLRYKGTLATTEWPKQRAVLQGVHMLYTVTPERAWQDGEMHTSAIVVIGQALDPVQIQNTFQRMVTG